MNPYLNTNNQQDQDLLENLITESIEIHGMELYYVPRTIVGMDEILGEDRLSKFKHAYPFTGYFESINQLEGNGLVLERYGGLFDMSSTITVSRRTWNEFVGRYGTTTIPGMPMAGDLLYMPLTDQLYEIKYVDDKAPFAQFGRFYTYKMNIALFQYSSEQIETDVDDINVFEDLKTLDQQHPERSMWGAIQKVEIIEPGYGYTSQPQLKVHSTYGNGAILIPIMSEEGEIEAVTILDGGEGYRDLGDVEIEALGKCTKPAKLKPIIATQIEMSGDKWGSNVMMQEFANDNLQDFNADDPFGELNSDLVTNNIRN